MKKELSNHLHNMEEKSKRAIIALSILSAGILLTFSSKTISVSMKKSNKVYNPTIIKSNALSSLVEWYSQTGTQ